MKSCSVLAVQADGAEVTTIEGLANGEWHPVQTAFKECHAPAVRLLHPGDDHGGDRPAPGERRTRARRRSATGSRATSAAAPATRTSSRQCSTRPPREVPDDRPPRPPRGPAEVRRPAAAPQGGRAAASPGSTNWTDNIELPGMLHMAIAAQPDGARPDHPGRRLAGPGHARRRRRLLRCRPRRQATSSVPCVWPVTDDIVMPDRTRPWRSTRCATSATPWRW